MDQNPSEGSLHVNFTSFSPFPSSVQASGKPSPAAGLSKPRLMKVRKHQASPRVKPVAIPNSAAEPGFSSIRSAPSVSNPPDRADGGGAQVLLDRLNTWNPFVPKSHSDGFVSGEGSGNFGSAGFVSAPVLNSKSEDIKGSVNMQGATFTFASEGSGNADTAPLVFESGVNKSSNLSRNPAENLSGLKLGSLESVNFEDADFVFGANTSLNSITKNAGLGSVIGSASSYTSDGSRNSDAVAFVFGSAVKSDSNLSQNSSFGSGEGSFSQLPDEMRKLKLQSTSNQRGHGSKVEENNGFIFGGSKIPPNEGSGNSDAAVFLFGSNMKISSSQNSCLGSDKGLFSQLPGEMMKLKLQSAGDKDGYKETTQAHHKSKVDKNKFIFGGSKNASCEASGNSDTGDEDSFGKTKQANHRIKVDENNFIFRGSKNEPSEENRNSDAGVFVFGSDIKDNSNLSLNTSFGSDDGSFSRLPFGMRKLNLHHSNLENTLPDDMKKLNINSKTENSVGSTERFFLADGLPAVEPTPLKFSFQAGKQDLSSSIGSIPQPQSYEYIRPSPVDSGFAFTSMQEGLETPHMEFSTQKQDTYCFSKENLFTSPYKNMNFSMKKDEVKGSRTGKRRGKSRQSVPVAKQFFSMEKISQENSEPESPGDYSPMDYSPYQENLVDDQCSRDASVASDVFIHFVSRCASTDSHISVSMDEREEELVSATRHLGINDGDLEHRELDEDGSKGDTERKVGAESTYVDVRSYGLENLSLDSKDEVNFDSGSRTTATEPETDSFSLNIEREAAEGGRLFTFNSSLEDHGESNFTFGESTSIQASLSASNRHYRRKSRMKTSQNSCNSLPNVEVALSSPSSKSFPVASISAHPDPAQSLNGTSFVPQTGDDVRAGKIKKQEAAQESMTTSAASVAAQEACEKWRLRGNQAYANGHLSKAEDYYSRGVNSVSLNETSRSCIQALMLCYSNRAATRMSLGRLREAISDCKMAIGIDPNFLRAQVRAANCHLSLGEIEDALKHFNKCLQSENNVDSHQKILIEASEGLRKAQQVADCMDQSAELLLRRTMNDATKALQTISEALSISPHSESLMKMKAEALLMLQSYEEVIQLCEETLDSAKKISIVSSADDKLKDIDNSPERLWRCRLISKSYFCLGKLDEALELLQKHEKVEPVADKFQNRSRQSFTSLSITIRELLCLKASGNEAFQAGKHLEAVEHYTAALACNTESRPFAAICFCNRAAAYQALGQITDAIADCTFAVALDASYPKAISRRATLHEMVRDYGQAANDLNRLISLLEKKSKDKNNMSRTLVRSTSNSFDLNQARLRLSTVEEEARKAIPLDMYIILGIEPSSSAVDVKKAYRRAALRHHPDKAGHFSGRNENIDERLWKEVADEVHMDAERLFKMIGEAYTVISDPTKRLQYDAEEEMRTIAKKGYSESSTPKTPEDTYSSQYGSSANRRQWREYGNSSQRWSEYSRSDW